MGETEQTGDAGFVANATSEETVSTPPADSETPTEAVEEQGAAGLTGEETVDEVKQYLGSKYKDTLSENDFEQLYRWRTNAAEAKALKDEVAKLREFEGSAKGYQDVVRDMAIQLDRQVGGNSLQILEREGLDAWRKYAFGTPEPEVEQPKLDPKDPTHQILLTLQKELEALKEDKAKTERERQLEDAASRMFAAADALELPDDEEGTAKGIATRLAEFELVQPGAAKDPQNPTNEEIAASFKRVKSLLSAYEAVITGKAKQEQEKVTPKTPEIKADSETTSTASYSSADWEENEKKGFRDRATRG